MLRSILSAVMLAALVTTSAARAQTIDVPREFNQTLIDRWLAAFPAITTLGQGPDKPASQQEGLGRMERICTAAGFVSFDQCTATIGYAGMLFAGFDPRSGTFRDPIAQAHDNIAIVEADQKLTPAAKEKAIARIRQIIATFPKNVPEEHLRLMTANRHRIFTVLRGAARK